MTPGRAARPFRFGPVLFTQFAPAAYKARTRMFEHHKGQNIPAKILECFGIGPNYHCFGCGGCTRSRISAHSFYFDHTQPACAERRQTRMHTKMGNRNIILQRALKNRLAFFSSHRLSIDRQFHFNRSFCLVSFLFFYAACIRAVRRFPIRGHSCTR